ncbi:hypothetical protein DU18_0062 [Chlamydia muridarum]|nr:hypothetical protein DU18_0062 [Chlamydia muridarum]
MVFEFLFVCVVEKFHFFYDPWPTSFFLKDWLTVLSLGLGKDHFFP